MSHTIGDILNREWYTRVWEIAYNFDVISELERVAVVHKRENVGNVKGK